MRSVTRTKIGEVISSGEVSILDLQQVKVLPHISSSPTRDAKVKHLASRVANQVVHFLRHMYKMMARLHGQTRVKEH